MQARSNDFLCGWGGVGGPILLRVHVQKCINIPVKTIKKTEIQSWNNFHSPEYALRNW